MPHTTAPINGPAGRTKRDRQAARCLCLTFTWALLTLDTELQTSAVGLRLAPAAGFACLAAAVVFGAMCAQKRNAARTIGVASYALAGFAAGERALSIGGTTLASACLIAQAVAAAGIALAWAQRLARLNARNIARMLGAALLVAGATQLAIFCVGSALGIDSNPYVLANLERVLLAVAIIHAACIEVQRARRDGASKLDVAPETSRAERERQEQVPRSLAALACLTCVVAQFIDGFTFQPFYASWTLTSCAGAALAAALGAGCLVHLALRRGPVALGGIVAVLAALGIVAALLPVFQNNPASPAARCLLIGVRMGLAAAALAIASRFEARLATVLVAVCMAPWALGAGALLREAAGLDARLLAPIAAVAAVLFAAAALGAAIGIPRQMRDGAGAEGTVSKASSSDAAKPQTAASNAACAQPPASQAAPQARPAVPASAPPAEPAAQLAQATHTIKKTREEALASFGLSKREMEVSLLMFDGLTAQAASEKLGISISTVKFHLSNSYHKLGVQSKYQMFELIRSETGVEEHDR